MPGVLLPREGEPTTLHPRLTHPGASRHVVAAYEAVPKRRLPASGLGNKGDVRRAGPGDRASLQPRTRGISAKVAVERTRPSLRPLQAHRGLLDVWKGAV